MSIQFASMRGERSLNQYLVASTRAADEAADIISHTYCDHQIRILNPQTSLNFEFSEAPLSRITVGAMSFDADIRYDLGVTETYYLIQFADVGAIEYVNGGETCMVTPESGMLTSPTRPLRIHYSEHSRGFIIKIQKAAMERHLRAMTGAEVTKPLIFSAPISRGSEFGARYKRLLHYLIGELDSEQGLNARDCPQWVSNIEDTVMTAVLTGQPHNYSNRFHQPSASADEHHVAEVEAFIRANATEALSVEDFVTLTGVSGRSLYRAFQKQRGYSPMAFARSVRFQMAQEMLEHGDPGLTVTQAALACGFEHLGRFSRDYHRRYGETPSETLRRAKTRLL